MNKRPKNSTQADRKTERIRDGWTDRGQFIGPTFKVSTLMQKIGKIPLAVLEKKPKTLNIGHLIYCNPR